MPINLMQIYGIINLVRRIKHFSFITFTKRMVVKTVSKRILARHNFSFITLAGLERGATTHVINISYRNVKLSLKLQTP